MAISQTQAENFINRTKNVYLTIITGIKSIQSVATENEQEVAAWFEKRNTKESKVNWRFTTDDARIKLKKLYPSLQE